MDVEPVDGYSTCTIS